MLGYYIVKLFSKLMCVSPKWFRDLLANILGYLACIVTPKWRMEMAKANIMECLGVNEERATIIAQESMKRFGRMAIEVLRFPLLNKENIKQVVKVDGLEYLEAAYKEDKGVIMATGHYGNWELLGATIALRGYPVLSVARRQNDGYMDKFINEYRQMVGQKIAYNRGGKDLLSISRILKEKHILGVVYDQDTNDGGVEVDLFGKKSYFPLGVSALSRLYGSPILPIFLHNNEDGTCTAKIYPPLYTPKTKNKEDDFYNVTKKLVTILEHEVIRDPDMWFWAHDRWKDGRRRFGGKKK